MKTMRFQLSQQWGVDNTVNLILIGFGNVGQGLAEILRLRIPALKEKHGLDLRVIAIVDRGGAAVSEAGVDLSKALGVKRLLGSVSAMKTVGKPGLSAIEVIEELDGDIVVEVTSNNLESGEPGLTHIKRALASSRHVVTTNKGPLTLALPQLLDLACRKNVDLRFSGAVGGAIPILDYAKELLYGDEILSIKGVLNGTTNYILWSMSERHLTMGQAINEAQKLGYAEGDISYDIDGFDTASKIVIISNWVMGRRISLRDVNIKGVKRISLEEMLRVKKKGFTIRLIGSISHDEIRVSPEEIPLGNPLSVGSNFNAVIIDCVHSGRHIIIGRGAGGKETASSVMRDIISIVNSAYLKKDCSRIFFKDYSSRGYPKRFYRTERLVLWGFM